LPAKQEACTPRQQHHFGNVAKQTNERVANINRFTHCDLAIISPDRAAFTGSVVGSAFSVRLPKGNLVQ
jgi:hypothetical protein